MTRHIAILELASDRANFIVDSLCRCGLSPDKVDIYRLHQGEHPRTTPIAAISSGGPGSILEAYPKSQFGRMIESAQDILTEWMYMDVPILAICLSHQILCARCGGTVRKCDTGLIAGFETVKVTVRNNLNSDIPGQFVIAQYHHDEVAVPPPGWEITSQSASCHIEAMRWKEGRAWSVQGHPELPAYFVQQHLLFGRIPSPGLQDYPGQEYDEHRLRLFKNFLALLATTDVSYGNI